MQLSNKSGKSLISPEVLERLKPVIPPRDQWTPVDTALYGAEDLFHIDKNEVEVPRFNAIKFSFEHHFNNNEFYRRYCQGEGVKPEQINEPSDLKKIPLIPDSFFKTYPQGSDFVQWLRKVYTGKLPEIQFKRNASFQTIMEALEEKGVTVTFTSGTSGRFSFFPRGRLTWMRQCYSLACESMEILGKTFDPERIPVQFAPHPLKTFLFIARGTAVAHEALFSKDKHYYLVDRKITPDSIRISHGMTHGLKEKLIATFGKYVQKRMISNFIHNLELLGEERRRVVLFGSPNLIESIIKVLEKNGRHLAFNNNALLITAGGWKMPTGAPMSEMQFRKRIWEAWGIPDGNCRDVYGMSECSSVFPGCEGHYKHIPHSILYPMVLGDDMKPVGYGQYGRFAFLDPLPESYPGFIMTGDRVKILESCPVCKRIGPVIESDVTRVKGSDERGCSSVMGELIASQIVGMSHSDKRSS